eukprot:1677072-Rhodomonas_salina.2
MACRYKLYSVTRVPGYRSAYTLPKKASPTFIELRWDAGTTEVGRARVHVYPVPGRGFEQTALSTVSSSNRFFVARNSFSCLVETCTPMYPGGVGKRADWGCVGWIGRVRGFLVRVVAVDADAELLKYGNRALLLLSPARLALEARPCKANLLIWGA